MALTESVVHFMPYLPTDADNNAFLHLHHERSISVDGLPKGFPNRFNGERVWTGAEMVLEQDKWIINLTKDNVNSITSALKHFLGLKLPPSGLTYKTFPLPQDLSRRLKDIAETCYHGRGFCVLRGLDPDLFTEEENVLVFAGVSAHVAPERGFQDVDRQYVVCHVVSGDGDPLSKGLPLRPSFTDGPVAFHSDVGDILCLYAMEVAEHSGETLLASSSQVYNGLASIRPDLIHALTQDWAFYQHQNFNQAPTPLLNIAGGQLMFQYSRLPVTGFRGQGMNTTLPPPSDLRIEAMAAIEALASKNAIQVPKQRGDILYLNNMSLLHARNSFHQVDNKVQAGQPHLPQLKRHLVKMFVRDPTLAESIPPGMQCVWDHVYGSNKEGGKREENWFLKYEPEQQRVRWIING